MTNKIINLLSQNKNLSLEDIVYLLDTSKDDIIKDIKHLEDFGTIYKNSNGKYMLTKNTSLKKGIVKITKRKGAIVVLEDGKSYDFLGNKKIYERNLHPNETVLVEINNNNRTAKLVKILKVNSNYHIGVVEKVNRKYVLKMKDHEDINLKGSYPLGIVILFDEDFKVVEELGFKDDPDMLVKETIAEAGLPVNFSSSYLEELDKIPSMISSEEIEYAKENGFYDLRHLNLFTLDSSDTKDFDDGICFSDNTLYISIVDFNRFIPDDSIINEETLKRKISVYTPGAVSPMIHHKISNGIGSLIEGEDRFANTLIVKFDDKGEIISSNIAKTIVNSKKKMTYDKVNKFLEGGILSEDYKDFEDALTNLYKISMKVKEYMLSKGFLEFSPNELEYIIKNNKVVNINNRNIGPAEETIEFLMILYNLTLLSYFNKHNLPLIARVHDKPNDEKMNSWANLLRQKGYDAKIKKNFRRNDIIENLSLYKDDDKTMKLILDDMAIKSMSKARYSSSLSSHFALGQSAYATFTAPIRRLSDYINERILNDSLEYGDNYARKLYINQIEYLAGLATMGEQAEIKVERTISEYNNCKYMEKYKEGDMFTAHITEIHKNYVLVLLDNMVTAKIYLDYKNVFVSEDNLSLKVKGSNDKVFIGDMIKVSLIGTNIDEREIICFSNFHKEKELESGKRKVKKI